MRHSRKIAALSAIALGALLAFGFWPARHAIASPTDELRRTLQRIDRQLCSKYRRLTCHRSVEKPEPQSRAKPPAKVTAATAAGAASSKPPVPVLKPENLKARTPVPVLKPANLTASKKLKADAKQSAAIDPAPGKIDLPKVAPQPSAQTAAPPKPVLKPSAPLAKPKVSPPAVNVMPDDALSGAACIAALRAAGADFATPATAVASGPCSVTEPVKLRSVDTADGRVKLPDLPLLTCGFAARLSSWLVEKGEPAVQKATGSRIVAMGTGPGYQCRGRNGDGSGKLSEHAFGNAVDIEYVKLANGQVIKVEEAASTASKNYYLLATLRVAGCQSFTTVLGPGANSSHASHLHFDLERRGKNGNHKLCQ